jgi:hypothetical protein
MIPSVAFDEPRVPLVAAVGSGRAVISLGSLQDAIAATKKMANSNMAFIVSVFVYNLSDEKSGPRNGRELIHIHVKKLQDR